MKKFKVIKDCDYVQGHLRSGHLEQIIEAESLEDAINKFEEDFAELVVDDYEVDDYETYGETYGEILESE